jgi:hypothetical protein
MTSHQEMQDYFEKMRVSAKPGLTRTSDEAVGRREQVSPLSLYLPKFACLVFVSLVC